MKWLQNSWLLVVPWLAVLLFAALATADDYGRFQQDKSEQENALRQTKDNVATAVDAWIEQAREIIEHYREEEERSSIEQALGRLQSQNTAVKEEMGKMQPIQFFPETLGCLDALAARLERLAEIAQGAYDTKTELLDAEARLEEAPVRITYYRERRRYFKSRLDMFNYYLAQEALGQSESVLIELQVRTDDLATKLDRWRERLDTEQTQATEDIRMFEENLKREIATDYFSYLRAKLRSFGIRRALRGLGSA